MYFCINKDANKMYKTLYINESRLLKISNADHCNNISNILNDLYIIIAEMFKFGEQNILMGNLTQTGRTTHVTCALFLLAQYKIITNGLY